MSELKNMSVVVKHLCAMRIPKNAVFILPVRGVVKATAKRDSSPDGGSAEAVLHRERAGREISRLFLLHYGEILWRRQALCHL